MTFMLFRFFFAKTAPIALYTEVRTCQLYCAVFHRRLFLPLAPASVHLRLRHVECNPNTWIFVGGFFCFLERLDISLFLRLS